ncbi:MAG: O-methyltransferase [Mangrovibacterium sp.]
MNIDLERYVEEHCSPEDELLSELDRETNLRVLQPRMLSGNMQGQLLTMLMQMIQPKVAIEIGTFTGYSAICLAKGMPEDSLLHTIEINDELETIATEFIVKAKLNNKIKQHVGDALNIIPTLDAPIDFVFMDGNKRHYCEYYEAVFDKLNVGGYILADNILWDGKVVREVDRKDKQTQGIIEFNTKVAADERVNQIILPIRDGLSLIRKNKY